MFERVWKLCVFCALGLFVTVSCDNGEVIVPTTQDGAGGDGESVSLSCLEALSKAQTAVCPVGSSPELTQTFTGVCDVSGSLVARGGVVMGSCADVADVEGGCELYCQLTQPCVCGVFSQTATEIVCDACPTTACGNAQCEPGEDTENCSIDCGPRCEAGTKRCYGKDVDTCDQGGIWERKACADNQVCSNGEGIVRCIDCDVDDPETWYIDRDGDLRGDLFGATFVGCSPPPRFSLDNSDCDDTQFDPPESVACDPSCGGDEPPREGWTRCGLNMAGSFEQNCIDGLWTDTSVCIDDDVCVNGEEADRTDPERGCGINAAGKKIRRCVEGAWADTEDCNDPHDCIISAPNRRGPNACNGDGRLEQKCVAGIWTDLDPESCLTSPLIPSGYVLIPAGVFQMGSPTGESFRNSNEKLHSVTISREFIMKEKEVTQGEWDDHFALPSGIDSALLNPANRGSELPVIWVSWSDALAYCNALSTSEGLQPCYDLSRCNSGTPGFGGDNQGGYSCPLDLSVDLDCEGYRLPTEAEWEYAVRAGTETAFYNGDITTDKGLDGNLFAIAHYDHDDNRKTGSIHPGGEKDPNAWGLYDMSGNVNEWVWDNYDFNYPAGPVTDPGVVRPSGSDSTLYRGGSYTNSPPFCRSALRRPNSNFPQRVRTNNIGLRPVRTIQ